MHSFRKVSARISAGGFCWVEIWVFWMDDFCEMEFYSSRIKLALLWVLGYFFAMNDEFCGGCGTPGLFTLPSLSLSLFFGHLACYEMDFFCLIWQKCLWLDFQAWCKSPKPFMLVPSKPNHIPALECLYTQVYGETFKQQWVGTDCLGFGLSLLWWLIFSLKFWLHNMSAHHNWWSFLPILMFRQENRKHIGLFWSYKFICYFYSTRAVCVSFNGHWNVLVYSNLVLALNDLLQHVSVTFIPVVLLSNSWECRGSFPDPWRTLEYMLS